MGRALRRFGCGEGERESEDIWSPPLLEGGRPFDFVSIRVVDADIALLKRGKV